MRQFSLFVRKRGTRFWHRASPFACSITRAGHLFGDVIIGLAGSPYEARVRVVTDGPLPLGSFVANEAEKWLSHALEAEHAEFLRKKDNAFKEVQ